MVIVTINYLRFFLTLSGMVLIECFKALLALFYGALLFDRILELEL